MYQAMNWRREGWVMRTFRLEDTEDFVTGDESDLGDTVRVTKDDTDLRWGQAFAGQFTDVVDDIFRSSL